MKITRSNIKDIVAELMNEYGFSYASPPGGSKRSLESLVVADIKSTRQLSKIADQQFSWNTFKWHMRRNAKYFPNRDKFDFDNLDWGIIFADYHGFDRKNVK